jgi:ribosomal protein S12 methylthiotransferase
MEHAQGISAQRLQRRVGATIQVLVDGIEGRTAIARSAADAPEIDGVVRITNGGTLRVGEFAQVQVSKADAYDLTARIPGARR